MSAPHPSSNGDKQNGSGASTVDALWRRYRKSGDPGLRERLFDQYLGLVHHAANEVIRRHGTTLERDDLVGAGTLGLVQALESYDPTRGTTFSTHAMPRIRGAMLDEIRSWDWLPRSARERRREVRNVLDILSRELGREPTAEEAATEMGVDLATWHRYAQALRDPVLLPIHAEPNGDEPSRPALAESLADPNAVSADRTMEHDALLAALGEALDTLSTRDRLILSLSFYERLTLREIAELLKITESRVSQLRTRALARLGDQLAPLSRAA